MAGSCLEAYVTTQVLAALAPAALEVSLAAAQQLERERADLVQLWDQRRERANYEAERAGRHYRQCEPEHRLVARQLAREWEAKLAEQTQVEEAYQRFLAAQPRLLTASEQATIRQLAADLPTLWAAPTITAVERKEILRQVVERVTVRVAGASEQVQVTIAWAGGARTSGTVIRPVARLEQLSYYPALVERVRALVAQGLPCKAIAAQLNAAGLCPPKRYAQFGAQGIEDLVRGLGLRPRQERSAVGWALAEGEWTLADLAQRLGMPPATLHTWVTRGWVQARQVPGPGGQPRWVIRADPAELARLEALRRVPADVRAHDRWLAATTPCHREDVTPTEYP